MANKGDLYLKNESVISLHEKTKMYEPTVQDAFYSHYKNTYKISVSNYFRGDAADSFKQYITDGAINVMNGFLDVSSEITMIVQLLAEAFFQYENTHTGRVEEGTLEYIKQTIKTKENTFNGAKSELNTAISLAAQYIAVKPLELESVNNRYSETRTALEKIKNDLYAVDDEALNAANELFERIINLKTLIEKLIGFCYTRGTLNTGNIDNLSSQDWYNKESNVTLYLLLQEDPFGYSAGEVTVAEDQWAAGLCSDVYAYAGYSFRSASYEAGVEDGTAFIKAKAVVASANGYAQFTDYLSLSAEAKFTFAEGEAKAGWSEKYKGFKVDAEVGLIDTEGSIILGSKDLNAYIKGEVKVLCADGKAAFEFEEDGQFAIGVDASATLASASAKGGTTILSYKDGDSATGDTNPLLGVKAGVKADAGGSFAVWIESKTAIETDFVNINATTVKLDVAFLLGVDLTVTIPTPHFKWSW